MKSPAEDSTLPLSEAPEHESHLGLGTRARLLADAQEFVEFIESGAIRLNPRTLARLFAELPDLREKLPHLKDAGYPVAAAQLAFLADVLEGSVTQSSALLDVPFRSVCEGAFALQYFQRAVDLVPDSLGPIGYMDDAAVAATVLVRNAEVFAPLAAALHHDWAALSPEQPSTDG